MKIDLHPDQCEHWQFYAAWIPGKELAIWEPGNKWNSSARNLRNRAAKKYFAKRASWSEWNRYLQHIYNINTSAKVRQGREMNLAYFEFPKEKNIVNVCPFHGYELFMVYDISYTTIVAYVILHHCGNFANISTIIGHKDYLNDGIMYLLMSEVQEYCSTNGIIAISYGEWASGHNLNGKNGLQYWKHSTGFKPKYLTL